MAPFQSTPSVWRETATRRKRCARSENFNPLPPCGGRQAAECPVMPSLRFQSTPSVWRETCSSPQAASASLFQSTPSAWRETAHRTFLSRPLRISIHSLRVEGDDYIQGFKFCPNRFQSTPSAWRETMTLESNPTAPRFQSTPSAWRET